MEKTVEKLVEEIRQLSDVEKSRLVDAILETLDKPDADIDRVWAEEARRRWTAYVVPRSSFASWRRWRSALFQYRPQGRPKQHDE